MEERGWRKGRKSEGEVDSEKKEEESELWRYNKMENRRKRGK